MNKQMEKDPRADPNCKTCNGYGIVDISGNICYGFGAKPEIDECMCILYKKLGMKM